MALRSGGADAPRDVVPKVCLVGPPLSFKTGRTFDCCSYCKCTRQVLPLMQAGLKAAKAVNGVGKLGKLFGFPMLEIPREWLDSAEKNGRRP